jgi:predicted esterase
MLAYVIAARHPDAVAYAFPIAGRIPAKLLPRGPAAPVYAMHGVDDDAIAIDFGREAIAAFRAAGNPAELREWPGVAHDITPAMRADLAAHLARIVGP